MNQKKSKRLRKQAEQMTIGKPKIDYADWRPPVYAPIKDDGGLIVTYKKVAKGVPIRLQKECTRKVYKSLKAGNRVNQ